MRIFEGNLSGKGLSFAIVASKFNKLITDKLLDGAINFLKQVETEEGNIDIFWVPGSFEIPIAVEEILSYRKYDAVICLGTLIRGETPHFEYIATHVTKSLLDLSIKHHTPVAFGIITANTVEEAIDRAGLKMGNKGIEATIAAVEMANLRKLIGRITV
ncbi:MAG: 6,7-dimethyl-8-ribityllumazine synthase [Brevinematia bacterium]